MKVDDEALIPIDIHCSKLLEWLLSRRHCNRDWQKNVMVIREKIRSAINDMPEDERILKLLQGYYINYFHCTEIVRILKDTEKDTKNLFGYYSSQRMNDWLEIKRLYERNNIYLAEAAEILQRMVQYEIPGLKREIIKSNQKILDSGKNEKEYAKQAEEGKKQYASELEKLGLKGLDVRTELNSSLSDLQHILRDIMNEIFALNEPLQYYEEFRTYSHQGNTPPTKVLPMIRLFLKKRSNFFAYEWIHGEEPDSVESPPLPYENTNEVVADDEIDFGIIDISDSNIDEQTQNSANFHIELIDDTHAESIDKTARGLEALSVLENLKTQQVFLYELKELRSFLISRKKNDESEVPSDMYLHCLENRPSILSEVNIVKFDKWLRTINSVLGKFSTARNFHLFKLRSSPKYATSIIEELDKKRSLEDRYKRLEKLAIENQNEMHENSKKAQENLEVITKATKQLQKQIEESISSRYNGRKVNIMGGIGAALVPLS